MTLDSLCDAAGCSRVAVTGWLDNRVRTPEGGHPRIALCPVHTDARTEGQRIDLAPRPGRLFSF